jgi:hypothetical protein
MSSETVTKRLHVGGITPNITATHIKERFSIFGIVTDIEELKPNALGSPLSVSPVDHSAYMGDR